MNKIGFIMRNTMDDEQEPVLEEQVNHSDEVVEEFERAKDRLKDHAYGMIKHTSYWLCLVSEILGLFVILKMIFKLIVGLFKRR